MSTLRPCLSPWRRKRRWKGWPREGPNPLNLSCPSLSATSNITPITMSDRDTPPSIIRFFHTPKRYPEKSWFRGFFKFPRKLQVWGNFFWETSKVLKLHLILQGKIISFEVFRQIVTEWKRFDTLGSQNILEKNSSNEWSVALSALSPKKWLKKKVAYDHRSVKNYYSQTSEKTVVENDAFLNSKAF